MCSRLWPGDDVAHSSIRFGLGRFNTQVEVDYVAAKVIDVVKLCASFHRSTRWCRMASPDQDSMGRALSASESFLIRRAGLRIQSMRHCGFPAKDGTHGIRDRVIDH